MKSLFYPLFKGFFYGTVAGHLRDRRDKTPFYGTLYTVRIA